MKKRLIGIILTLVIATQVFPVDGIRFWSNLMQSSDHNTTSVFLALEEEEVEEVQFKVKHIESNHSMFFESQMTAIINRSAYPIIAQLGNVIDRNNTIITPPPNTII